MASIGVFRASTAPGPNFIQIFTSPVTAGLALLIFLAVPLIIIVTELIWEKILERAEDRTKPENQRIFLYSFFLLSTFGTFFALLSALIGMGLTGYDSAIQLAFVIWGVRLLINWVTVKPLWITGTFFARKFFGKDRPANEPTVRRCPGVLCCKSQDDEDKYAKESQKGAQNNNKEDV